MVDYVAVVAAAGRREQNKAVKRDRILRAASKLFDERGYKATTTTEVARAAGIGTGTLFLYVRTKEDLLIAVFRDQVGRAWNEAFDSADPASPLLEQLMHAFGEVIDYHARTPELAHAFIREVPAVSDEARAGARDFMRWYVSRLDEFLVAARDGGLLATDVPTDVLATNLYSAYHYHLPRCLAGHQSKAATIAALRAAFSLQLRGLVP